MLVPVGADPPGFHEYVTPEVVLLPVSTAEVELQVIVDVVEAVAVGTAVFCVIATVPLVLQPLTVLVTV